MLDIKLKNSYQNSILCFVCSDLLFHHAFDRDLNPVIKDITDAVWTHKFVHIMHLTEIFMS